LSASADTLLGRSGQVCVSVIDATCRRARIAKKAPQLGHLISGQFLLCHMAEGCEFEACLSSLSRHFADLLG
jgi:hypothetical protein